MKKIALEICVGSVEHARAAERGGADRIELCTDLTVGGTTPSAGLMKITRDSVRVPVHVMIRPRPGDFFYTAVEFATMQEDLGCAQQCGVDGVVLGLLDARGRVDAVRTRQLVDLAHPLPVTFHRAFDESGDLGAALEAVIETGAARILTSGGAPRAMDGIAALKRLVKQADTRITIMPCGGINAGNAKVVAQRTFACEIHSSAGLSGLPVGRYGELDSLAAWEQDVRRLRAGLDGVDDHEDWRTAEQ